jgi:catechol-2,3-dioxygenase
LRGSSTRSTNSPPHAKRCSTRGAYSGESSHGATKSVYGTDPDGNEFELMWMLPRSEWGPYEHAAPIDHLDLAGEVRRWSGVRTAGQLVPHDARVPS